MMRILWGRPLMSLLYGARSRTSVLVAALPPWHWRGCPRRVWLGEEMVFVGDTWRGRWEIGGTPKRKTGLCWDSL